MGETEPSDPAEGRLHALIYWECRGLGAESATCNALGDAIIEAYASPGRHYHNLAHIEHLWSSLYRFVPPAPQCPAAYWAAIYHDVVYEPLSPGNEAKSAEWAERDLATMGAPPELVDQVRQMILATAKHLDVEAEGDLATFLDCDLLILGSTPEEYVRYRRAIRAEYHAVPDDAYCFGRRMVLERFLAAPRIYRNPRIFEQYEESARRNLEWEISELG